MTDRFDQNLRRSFTDRSDLITYLQGIFPETLRQGDGVSNQLGGYKAAQAHLNSIDPQGYGSTRNYLQGAVTHLSPYLRHGVLSLREVHGFILTKVTQPQEAESLIRELAWRDYWQRLYQHWGEGIWDDREAYKTGWLPDDYGNQLPQALLTASTGLVCMDTFSDELQQQGYLHNHARLWLAAYVVHWLRIRWQVGATWFLTHLLDGDPASNNLSWQWVASTFSQKPYFFNRQNLETYSHGVYCQTCSRYGHCPFEGSYEEVSQRLFPGQNTI